MKEIRYLETRDLKGLKYFGNGLISCMSYHSPAELAQEIKRKHNLNDGNMKQSVKVYYDREGLLKEHGLSLYCLDGKYVLKEASEKRTFSSLDELFQYVGKHYRIYIDPLEEIYQKRVITEDYIKGHLIVQFIKTITSSKDGEEISIEVRCGADKVGRNHPQALYDLDEDIKDMIYSNSKSEPKIFQKRDVYTFSETNLIEYYGHSLYQRGKSLNKMNDMSSRLKLYLDTFGSLEQPFLITVGGVLSQETRDESEEAFDFLLKSGLRGTYIENPVDKAFRSLKSREEKKELLKSRPDFNASICTEALDQVNVALANGDFVLCDQGLLECFIWENMFYQCGVISEEEYKEFLKAHPIPKNCRKFFYTLFKGAEQTFINDMKSNSYIRPRLTKSLEVLQQYDKSYANVMPLFEENDVQVKEGYDVASDVIEMMLSLQRKR